MRHNQNRRSRGRSRKGGNPATRSYDSNGPEVKIRGTASHVAEKYSVLARDALSSGDTVAAENYFQHAEHYNRIIMAAQAQFQSTQPREDQNTREDQTRDDQSDAEQPVVSASPNGANVNLPTEDTAEPSREAPQTQAATGDEPVTQSKAGNADEDSAPGNGTRQPRQRRAQGDGPEEGASKPRKPRRSRSQPEDNAETVAQGAPPESPTPESPTPESPTKDDSVKAEKATKPAEPEAADGDENADKTRDGAAALAAFPD